MTPNLRELLFSDWRHFLSLGLGSGLSPKAPGTMGTLVALPFYFLIRQFNAPLGWFITGLSLLVGIYICHFTASKLDVEDPSAVVWDEIVAFLMMLLWVKPQGIGLLWAFLLFRLFDIWKPYPICWADRHIKGGLGIMLDDLLAMFFAVGVWYSLEGLIVGF
ncbi:MAG: phosphatidylglycerophosphatase A [Ferrovum sp. 37-45-19]|jgi:phosphatidylglycerophosphatase A|uniref:phosphatidylglycerophosphatase A family protein n=1 Tax=Ferrovum sp. JA12 TaxID=1356299 RepID=UPI000703708C|nr:phosphatidylglycerophosphatase A [Ferrovum sp. JA12]OYV79845.1 MAG: phosphatidylglycerophosphatase A [Ferrovum sp. 21-44-67]OYV95469.1 MAG: phosphatidylglycerophosphatase A [Ferrovum sp. 37-45-19]OZB31515.1 MAG: phosphatidylglycerophosphatase A [Ferrovum sp. 34-44-207]HQT81265.1 phosphatidylglycerophosphatase A [Ferrovaceae bacterium]KRH78152.1 phosphatidylglycerophosphatase A [Ferrovum sp. JA12]